MKLIFSKSINNTFCTIVNHARQPVFVFSLGRFNLKKRVPINLKKKIVEKSRLSAKARKTEMRSERKERRQYLRLTLGHEFIRYICQFIRNNYIKKEKFDVFFKGIFKSKYKKSYWMRTYRKYLVGYRINIRNIFDYSAFIYGGNKRVLKRRKRRRVRGKLFKWLF